ncbi:hypothetical protein M3O96_09295 [Aquiflexum sp. TKW24L]|uniref:hypothetical protein n=1 Tax=Aquiflexum sp. TKW24L TaxID=2942212 RepID=UPI0020BF4CCD|nr:hypothetical protein [Aquiflexum sp. TKW24L]MCL6259281.1 hypothetical protein [Aquiflexum sp. TKW24L]
MPKNNQLIIDLSDTFKTSKSAKVIIEEIDDIRSEKIELLKKASSDPLFLSDVAEINSDFEYSDKG